MSEAPRPASEQVEPRPMPSAGPGATAPAGPGETARPERLERPPSERYRVVGALRRTEPDRLRSLLFGLGAGAVTCVAWAFMAGILELRTGLLAVAAGGGWAIGLGVRRGAWGDDPHPPSARGPIVAGAIAAATWFTGLVLTWVVAMALLQASSRSLLERLSATPFLDWMGPQVGLVEPLSLLVIVGVAAWSAHDR